MDPRMKILLAAFNDEMEKISMRTRAQVAVSRAVGQRQAARRAVQPSGIQRFGREERVARKQGKRMGFDGTTTGGSDVGKSTDVSSSRVRGYAKKGLYSPVQTRAPSGETVLDYTSRGR
jgi:hypothetical protein